MVPPSSRGISRVPRYSNQQHVSFRLRGSHPLRPALPARFGYKTHHQVAPPEWHHGLLRFRSPLLTESRLISSPPGTEMFHFPGFAPNGLCIQPPVTSLKPAGLPHSEISGSTPACGSPKLIAACHVLHRLWMPRHPPCALSNLTDANNQTAHITNKPPTTNDITPQDHTQKSQHIHTRNKSPRTRCTNGALGMYPALLNPAGKTHQAGEAKRFVTFATAAGPKARSTMNTPIRTVKERERRFLPRPRR